MKKKLQYLLIPVWLLWSSACQVDLEAIDYGNDVCEYCKMTIVDATHSAKWITDKGKVYKFDAIECMIHFREDQDTPAAEIWVANFESPGKHIEAQTSHFLISREIPSPMGAYLSAFASENTATRIRDKKGGKVYSWEALIRTFEESGMPQAD